MGKVLVLYQSQTGNTKAMAEFVAKGASSVDGIDVRVRSIDDADAKDLLWCDGLALGAPTHLGTVPWAMKKWWDEVTREIWFKMDGKIAGTFSSAGGLGGGHELTCQTLATIMLNFGMLVFGIPDYVDKGYTLHYGSVGVGRPETDAARQSCMRLGRRLAEYVAVYFDGRKDLHPTSAEYRKRR